MSHVSARVRTRIPVGLALLLLLLPTAAPAQNIAQASPPSFHIVVEATAEQIKLRCDEGCAWRLLSIEGLAPDQGQVVDQYGMVAPTHEDRVEAEPPPALAAFRFVIERVEGDEGRGLNLQCEQGCAWSHLSFWGWPGWDEIRQEVNEVGMVPVEDR